MLCCHEPKLSNGILYRFELYRKPPGKTVKKELLNSLKENNNLEETDFDATTEAITDPKEAVRIMQRYEEIIKTQNRRVIGYVGGQVSCYKSSEKQKSFLKMWDNISLNFIVKYLTFK